ncbi:T9SS type A sorting domain-containing protein [candidate division WOR-3 bacterium]|nr:T9SS type A sorting domain-containing protein [candidate division WOR-3 bacterium]
MLLYNKYVFSTILTVFLIFIPMNAISQRWDNDIMIYEGKITCFDVDYTMDGTMYLGFQKDSTAYPICFYTSSDHGMSWEKRHETASFGRISKMNIIVGEPLHNYLYFFFVNPLDSFPYVLKIPGDFSGPGQGFRIDTVNVEQTGFDVVRSIEDDYSMVFAGATPSSTSPDAIYWIKCYRSTDYGENWSFLPYGFSTPISSRQEFSIAWGPPSNYYLSYIKNRNFSDPFIQDSFEIKIFYSTNGGADWAWSQLITNNSVRDGDPHIAASHDVNNPAIWISSPRIGPGVQNDLYVHYVPHPDSIDAYYPLSWPSTPIATTSTPEYWGDIEFNKVSPNQYVNMAWIYDNGGDARDIHWTWSAGSNPGTWNEDQVINEHMAHPWPRGAAPRVVYSPGAPESGGGVIYSGYVGENLYFDAPWVSGIEEKDAEIRSFSVYPEILFKSETLLLSVPHAGYIELRIYDISGRLVDKIGPQFMNAGENLINPELKGTGIYLIEVLEGNIKTYRGKIITVK